MTCSLALIHCKCKILSRVDSCHNVPKFILKCFDPTLRRLANHEILLPSGAGPSLLNDRPEMHRCRTILSARTLVSQSVPCLGKMVHGEETTKMFHAVTRLRSRQLMSRDAERSAMQNNHQCQREDQVHAIEQEKKRPHSQKARIHVRFSSNCSMVNAPPHFG